MLLPAWAAHARLETIQFNPKVTTRVSADAAAARAGGDHLGLYEQASSLSQSKR